MTNKRTNVFTIGIESKDGKIQFREVYTTVEVTEPNEYGVFKIITQIGNEAPTIRETTINNENIVKTS